jgi:peptidoglycan/LPS O-acetylase OafA/YrhL
LRYRPEIDGLRALAVVPVILFHAGLDLFSGGFVGVDVFFVISGYLITTIIINELDQGKFSVVTFYERRARRILPALFFVILVTLPFAWMWLTPRDMKDFAQSLAAVATFSSNILFLLESGYFDTSAELKPLLHTWSLAVEEQYYIFFPLLLMLTWRFGRRWTLAVLAVIFVFSFSLGQWAAYNQPSAAFYLLPTRGWELLVGAFAAFYLQKRDHIKSQYFNQVASLLGVLLVAYAVFAFDKRTPFPTFYTLVPTIGTALIIFSAVKGTITNTLLSTKIMVGIGLISYSAYLWHQPMFALVRHRSLNEPSITLLLTLGALSLTLAYFSWKYIETPFRNKVKYNRKKIFTYSGIGIALLIGLGVLGHLKNGVLHDYDDATKKMLMPELGFTDKQKSCHREGSDYAPLVSSCILGDENHVVGALIGDSHGYAVSTAIEDEAAKQNIGLYQMTFNGCPTAGSVYRVDFNADNKCAEFNADVEQFIIHDDKIKNVVMVSRWTQFLTGTGFNNTEGGIEKSTALIDNVANGVRERNPDDIRLEKLKKKTISAITAYLNAGKKVILVYPVPEVGWAAPEYVAKQTLFGEKGFVTSTSYALFKERNKVAFETLDAIPDQENLTRIYPDKLLCNTYQKDRCVFVLNGEPLYFDNNHLSKSGAKIIVDEALSALHH